MFILIGEAYRKIESDHNPLLREARKKAAEHYESGPSENTHNFKSRRKENRENYEDTAKNEYEKAYDWNEEKFLRRYRYQHLRSDSSVPMSIRNVDRHGLGNLRHEGTKPFDRLKVPPFVVYVLAIGLVIIVIAKIDDNTEL